MDGCGLKFVASGSWSIPVKTGKDVFRPWELDLDGGRRFGVVRVFVLAKMGSEGVLNFVERKRAVTERDSFIQRKKTDQDSNVNAYIFNNFMPPSAAYRESVDR